ncbi:hypothetical protein RS030_213427 [Cryptosporidium xiaoi]|uniref:Uncharacterized protein n=1 Tax=Cryptosporidium xiaoi TaxID=659607 RepID=A0AAV9XX94_9CRYT
MNKESLIPRRCYEEDTTKEIYSKYSNDDIRCESGRWVAISGFPRKFISLIRPILEFEIGPIDHWINNLMGEDNDIYFVLFRNNRFSQKSLQYNELNIFGVKIYIRPIFDHFDSELSHITKYDIPEEEYFNNLGINIYFQ